MMDKEEEEHKAVTEKLEAAIKVDSDQMQDVVSKTENENELVEEHKVSIVGNEISTTGTTGFLPVFIILNCSQSILGQRVCEALAKEKDELQAELTEYNAKFEAFQSSLTTSNSAFSDAKQRMDALCKMMKVRW